MSREAQFFLNIGMLFYGSVAAIGLCGKLNVALLPAISWLSSWLALTTVYVFLSIAGVIFGPVWIISSMIILLAALLTLFRRQYIESVKLIYRGRRWKNLINIYLLSFIVIGFITLHLNYISVTADSLQYYSLAKIFHYYGHFEQGTSDVLRWFQSVRLPLFTAVHSFSYLLGIDVYYSFSPVTSFFLVLFFVFFCFDEFRSQEYALAGTIWFLLSIFLLCSSVMYLMHSFYYHSNLTVAAYFSAAFFLLILHIKQKNLSFFLFACAFLAATVLIRKEMFVFSLLPIFFCLYFSDQYNLRIRLIGLAVFLLIGYPWSVWGSLQVFTAGCGAMEKYNEGHGSIILPLFALFLAIPAFLTPIPKLFRKYSHFVILGSLLFLVIIVLCFKRPELTKAAKELSSLIFTNNGKWNIFWYCVAASIVLYYCIMFLNAKANSSNCLGINQFTAILNFTFSVIICFFLFRVLLYTVFNSPKSKSFLNSGNRVLLHFYPVAVYFCCLTGYVFSIITVRVKQLEKMHRTLSH